ncbi:MAG: FecR domain-containing protein [Pseudomonadota bacterium]
MPDPDDVDPEDIKRAREAASIHQRLDLNPDDLDAKRDRDEFLARGEAERDAYARIAKGVEIATRVGRARKRKQKKPPQIILLLAVAIGAVFYFFYQPASIYLRADHITGLDRQSVQLASGAEVTLDASSAIIDRSDGKIRRVELLKGAAYFVVERDPRGFAVGVDGIIIEVTGTEFEVTKLDHQILVGVAEGSVDVDINGRRMALSAGDQLRWSPGQEPIVTQAPLANIGIWRQDDIVADGMTFSDVVEILDRRIPGPVYILSDDISQTPFGGRLNLSDPAAALRTIAAVKGANVRSAAPLATIVVGP